MPGDPIVHVVDDEPEVRQSLAFLLSAAGFAVRAYGSAEAFLAAMPGREAGCVVTDIRMPGVDGIALQERLNRLGHDLPVIFVTAHGDVPLAVCAMKAGAVDFIEKPFEAGRLVAAVRGALGRGGRRRASGEVEAARRRLSALTRRERDVLNGILAGHSNKVIAHDLNLSMRTVEVHRARLMDRMQARNTAELIRWALMTREPVTEDS